MHITTVNVQGDIYGSIVSIAPRDAHSFCLNRPAQRVVSVFFFRSPIACRQWINSIV